MSDTDSPRPDALSPQDHPDQAIDREELPADRAPVGEPSLDASDGPDTAVAAWRTVLLDRRRRLCVAYAHGLDESVFDQGIAEVEREMERFDRVSARAAAPRVRHADRAAHQDELCGRRLHLSEFTWADRAFLLAQQSWCCAVCGEKTLLLDVDVDPETLVVRGMLCFPCNRALVLLGDDVARVERAARYLAGNGPAEEPAPDAPR